MVCPGFVRTPLVDKQIPEQAAAPGISEQEDITTLMLKDTVDGEFTTLEDVVEAILFCAAFPSTAITGQSLIQAADGPCSSCRWPTALWLMPVRNIKHLNLGKVSS